MSRTTSPLFKTMANAQETGEVLLALVTISSSQIVGGPLRVVQDLQNLVSNGNTYTAFPFQIQLPSDTEDGVPHVKLVIDNIDRTIATTLRGIPPTEPPTVQVDLVIASQPDVVEVSLPNLVLRNITGDAIQIEGELRFDEEDLIDFPEGAFTPKSFPGMFK